MISSDKLKNRSIKRYDTLLKHSFLAIIIIVVLGFFIFFFFDHPTNSAHKKMKKIKKPKTN
jgi:C4-dicarboxylate transporter